MKLPSHFHARPVRILVAGCGGTGSHIVAGLARLNACLRGLDHPGLAVEAWDPDRVTEANVGRQLFAPGDIGLAKADVLIHRANLWFGLDWHSAPWALTGDSAIERPVDLLIGCVDSARARRDLDAAARTNRIAFWLDCGNEDAWGQVVLGQPTGGRAEDAAQRLPTVLEMFPDMADGPDTGPSCSLAEALGRQGAFINQAVATQALDALWRMLRTGRIDRFAWFINQGDGRTASLIAHPDVITRYIEKLAPQDAPTTD